MYTHMSTCLFQFKLIAILISLHMNKYDFVSGCHYINCSHNLTLKVIRNLPISYKSNFEHNGVTNSIKHNSSIIRNVYNTCITLVMHLLKIVRYTLIEQS